MDHIGILGAGAWGTALAASCVRAGRKVTLWAFEEDVVEAVNTAHENPVFLPDVKLDPAIGATNDLAALGATDAILLVCPAQHLRALSDQLVRAAPGAAPLVICAKGIEQQSLSLMSDVLAETAPGRDIAALSGPTFAREVADNRPTAVTLAASDEGLARTLVQALGHNRFRPYLSHDVVGAQIGGAVKNVLAIAAGIVAGARLGDNAAAALITRGLAEIIRLGTALGAQRDTLMGLSGLGDLVLTCGSPQSRNMSLGMALGEGRPLKEILGGRKSVTEGVFTASAVTALAAREGVEMPICSAMDRVLNHGGSVADEIEGLLSRPFKTETN